MTRHHEGHGEEMEGRDDPRDARWIEEARRAFNPPPPPPVDEMWAVIGDAIGVRDGEERPGLVLLPDDAAVAGNGRGGGTGSVEPLAGGASPAEVRSPGITRGTGIGRRSLPMQWGWAAAAVLLLTTGVILGRWSAQGGPDSSGEVASATGGTAPAPAGGTGGSVQEGAPSPALVRATRELLDRSEAFLVGLRADADRGTLDPAITAWAGTLLSETRLLLDSRAGRDAVVAPLLRDLEWILVQVTALPVDGDRRTEELRLLNDGIDEQDVLFRMRAVEPLPGMAGAME